MSKLLSVGLMVGVIGFSVQTATAGRWHHWYGGCTCPSAPAATAWQGAATAQPMAAQASPAPAAGQTAQSNGQTYQSFSAEPAPAPAAPSGPTAAPYAAGAVNGGYYGGPAYGGPVYASPGNLNSSQNNPAGNLWTTPVTPSNYGSQGSWDTANNHGIPGQTTGSGGGGGSSTVGGTVGAPY